MVAQASGERQRQKNGATSWVSLTIQEHLRLLNMEVVLREPLEEELEEMREWVRERAAI